MSGSTISRRGLLGLGAVGTGAALAGGAVGVIDRGGTLLPPPPATPKPFYGAHQAGIATPVQDRLVFATFDVVTADRAALRDLLRTWTAAAAAMAAGEPVPGETASGGAALLAPPADTGEAAGLPASRLTVTRRLRSDVVRRALRPGLATSSGPPAAARAAGGPAAGGTFGW